ncbi:MAG: diguanylate cyclase [PVC group bacterium]|nr:diguanylate cyclase [PVC group bacterium]
MKYNISKRRRINEVFQAVGGQKIKITISIGIACITAGNNEFVVCDLIERADKALYLDKQKGRNRTEVGRPI